MRRWPLRLIATFGVLAGVVLGTRMVSRSVLYPAGDLPSLRCEDDVTQHRLVASDGVSVHALELRGAPGTRTVVHFHNNRETVEACLDFARAVQNEGLGIVLVEYRGYGASRTGEPSEEGLYLDAEAALDMLEARGIGPESIVLSGTSLGTGVAAEMARRGRGSRLVLMAPYTSIPDLVTDVVPFFPATALVPDHFETLAKAPSIAIPTLVIHGTDDEIVPFWMGREVAGRMPDARLLEVDGGRHGDLFVRERERLLRAIRELAG